ncbi:MAG: sterol desaturase family protein [Agriterribacter sp.]
MRSAKNTIGNIWRDAVTSGFIYALPVALMLAYFKITGQQPWKIPATATLLFKAPAIVENLFKNLSTWGLPVLTLLLGIIEFSAGLYKNKWNKNEAILDIVCFAAPKLVFRPLLVYVSLTVFPYVLPAQKNAFSWVPFWWACLIIAVADDLTQYWYHRLHHQVPWLWRFHRTHHSADYMGMAMAGRQNFIYTIFFSQIYLTSALTYLGLGYAALFVGGVKSLITLSAHSSIPWDKPFYKYKLLNPIAWVLERTISTPATHHAHHADTHDDGIGYYKGNFGNMFFIWDIIFGTAKITRKYPTGYGIKHYKEEEWYAQFLWPIFKSKKEGSELSANGPMVADIETTGEEENVSPLRIIPQG